MGKLVDKKIRKLCCIISTCKGEKIDLVHKLPRNKQRAIEWLKRINLPSQCNELSLEKMRNRVFICRKHFRKEDYKHSMSRELNKTANPSLLLNTNEYNDNDNDNDNDDDDDDMDDDDIDDGGDGEDDNNSQLTEKNRNNNNSDSVLNMDRNNSNVTRRKNTSNNTTIQNNNNLDYLMDDNNSIDLSDEGTLKSNALSLQITTNYTTGIESFDVVTSPIEELEPHRTQSSEMFVISTDNNSINNNNNDNNQITESDSESDMNREHLIEYVVEDDFDVDDIKNDTDEEENIDDQNNDNIEVEIISVVDEECIGKNDELPNNDKQLTIACAMKTIAKKNVQQPRTTKPMITQCTESFDCIQIKCENISETLTINNIWLRDHCRCNSCYNHSTFQRRTNINTIPLTIQPLSIELDTDDDDEEYLTIKWKNDGHVSKYNLLNLYQWLNEFNPNATLSIKSGSLQRATLWNQMDIQNFKYARVKINDYICDDTVTKEIVKSLIQYGLAFIEGVPATLTSTEIAVKRLFPIQKTLFGDMWSFNDTNTEHSDTAYTKEYLGAHTDNTYFCDAAGLQIFHCIQHTNGIGGESLLIDGFKVLKNFKANHPQSYDRLCTVNVTAEYIEDGHHHKYCSPIIKLNPITKEPEQIRFNLYDRAPMNTIPQSELTQFYTDLNLLTQEIQSKENEWWFKLNPGTILFFDNWRVLHGRAAYTGRRQMTGCYVSRTDFQSVARTMGIIN